jgi:hypothetical protein
VSLAVVLTYYNGAHAGEKLCIAAPFVAEPPVDGGPGSEVSFNGPGQRENIVRVCETPEEIANAIDARVASTWSTVEPQPDVPVRP